MICVRGARCHGTLARMKMRAAAPFSLGYVFRNTPALAAGLLIALLGLTSASAQDLSHGQLVGAPSEELQGYIPGADRLEGRIRAPCCWNQTLDIHGSEVSNALRREIRHRLRAGEGAESIEADLVSRYGQRVLAVPPQSPLKSLAVVLSASMGLAGIGAVVMLIRWRRRSARATALPESTAKGPVSPERDALDKRLDHELESELSKLAE